jgi:imidazolonepropionase-like amidohydrolase
MADQDITLVATSAVYEELLRLSRAGKTSPAMRDTLEMRLSTHRRSVELALEHGVRIATGTDMCIPYTTLAPLPDELATLVNWGLSPMQAIKAGTRCAAEALGKSDLLGTIQPGKLADLLVLDRSPLENISAFRQVKRVMQAGKWVK